MPNRAGPATRAPLIDSRQNGVVAVTIRIAAASATGPPSSKPRNTDRRDHSIWPSDRSKTRSDAASADWELEVAGWGLATPDWGLTTGDCGLFTYSPGIERPPAR